MPPTTIHTFDSTLLNIEDLTATVRNFTFSTPADFSFQAGEFVTALIHHPTHGCVERPYSIASDPKRTGSIDLCIRNVGGDGTDHFFHMQLGDPVQFKSASGDMQLNPAMTAKDIVLVSSGTGISPYPAIVPALLDSGFKHTLRLFSGFRHETEILYEQLWDGYQRTYPNFAFTPIVSRPQSDTFSGERGRVQSLIKKFVPRNFDGHIFLCGSQEMVGETVQLLNSRGVPAERIIYDRYA